MTFETYDPTKHTLEVGTKIRLGGRDGEIGSHYPVNVKYPQIIYWDDNTTLPCDISKFPQIEIAVSPLTIDKRVKWEIIRLCKGEVYEVQMVQDYINSLEEV